ncbi:MAG: hypothetical protein FJX76_16945, partial [Armatimonadetes bacterium]|nr:hypothetical protein [Armatimonadota bacterium]
MDPRVPHAERAEYEARARKDFPRFNFTRRVRQGVMGVVEPRPVYYPVYYQEPLVGDGIALGFDLGTNPARLEAFTRAMETARPSASARVILVEETQGRYSVLLFAPIYQRRAESVEARREALAGYALGVFRIGDLVEEALRRHERQAISVTLYDDSATADEQFLYHSPFAPEDLPARTAEQSSLRVSNPLEVGGRSWRMVAAATPDYIAARRSWQPILLPLAIFCLTLVVAGWMAAEIHRRARVEALAAALQQSNDDLQRSYKELEQSQEALRESEHRLLQGQKMESIGRLAGGVAHDFNNLLTAIFSYLESAMMKLPPDDAVRSDLAHVQESAERAANLTRQLLAFARKQPVAPRVVRLDQLVNRLAPLLRRLVGADVEVSFETVPDLGNVRIDPGQLEMVLVNLAVNARDAMPHGGILRVTTGNVTLEAPVNPLCPGGSPGEHVMLSMTDTGVGMSPEVEAQIFEPFFTTKGPGKGTGLGLATC